MRYLVCLSIIICTVSCGKKDHEEIDNAVLRAQTFLSSGNCQAAIDELQSVSFQDNDKKFLVTYASAFACRAGFSVTRFFSSDISLIASNISDGLRGFSLFSTSSGMSTPDYAPYLDLGTATDTLLYAGGIPSHVNPSIARRRANFSPAELNDINSLLFYLLSARLGLYLNFYGNASDTSGLKGAGGGLANSNCFLNYTNVSFGATTLYDLIDSYNLVGNACNDQSSIVGNVYLGSAGNLNKASLCEGVVILNNFLLMIPEVIAGLNIDSLNSVNGILSDSNAIAELLEVAYPSAAVLSSTTGQTVCELYDGTATTNHEVYFAFYYEALFL